MLDEYGIGETTTPKQLTRHLLERRAKNKQVPLPIFVDLRRYYHESEARKVPSLEELLTEVIRGHAKAGEAPGLTPAEIVSAVQNDGVLILCDGLDEKIVHYTPDQAHGGLSVGACTTKPPAAPASSPPSSSDHCRPEVHESEKAEVLPLPALRTALAHLRSET